MTLLDMRDVNRKIFNAMGAQDRTQTSPAFFAPYIRAAVVGSADAEVKRAADLMLSFNGRYEDLDRDGTTTIRDSLYSGNGCKPHRKSCSAPIWESGGAKSMRIDISNIRPACCCARCRAKAPVCR